MEIKKSAKASLENKKSDFLLIGLVVALGFLYITFEWTKFDVKKLEVQDTQAIYEEEEMMEVTVQKETPPPPPPAQQAPPVVTPEINLKDNDVEVKEVEIKSSEDDGSAVEQEVKRADDTEVIEDEEEIFMKVEKKADFPGGMKKMMEWLSKNIKYPQICMESGIQGRVIVQFTVNKNGSIQDVEVLRGVHEKLDEEAMRVVKAMPAWTPGQMNGRPVRSKFQLPVMFRLAD